MESGRDETVQINAAKIISLVFHPLLVPLYGIVVIFTAPTLFWYLPFNLKKILILLILANNVIIPVSLMPFLRYRNIINSWALETRGERVIPLLSASLLYFVTSFIMFRLQIPLFLKAYSYSISFISILVLVINFWWKISLHATGAGVLAGIVVILSLKMSAYLIWFIIPVILVAGLVLSSRLKLNSHNPLQVYTGFLTGFAGLCLFMLLLQ
jgi:membrane-associated phospholipid phosphatase